MVTALYIRDPIYWARFAPVLNVKLEAVVG